MFMKEAGQPIRVKEMYGRINASKNTISVRIYDLRREKYIERANALYWKLTIKGKKATDD